MANITNIASVKEYTYTVGTDTKKIQTPITSTVSNVFNDPQIRFSKICTPSFADLNEIITLTYQVENIDNTTGSPVLTTIEIADEFLEENIPFIDITIGSNVIKYNQAAGTFQMLLPSGLTPGNTVSSTFTFVVSPGFDFTQNITTTATASFALSPTGTLPSRFSSCGSTIQNGTLQMEKTASPTTAISSGSVVTYKITITNIGNVPATIPASFFSDPIPAGATYIDNTISPVGHFVYDTQNNAVTNADDITIANNTAPYIITFSVRIL